MPMSPRRRRRAVLVAKMAYHRTLTRSLAGSGVTADEFFVLTFLTLRVPWQKWAVRNVAAHLHGPWQRRALRNLLVREAYRGLDKAGADAVLAGLQQRGLLAGTRVTEAGHAVLAEHATRPLRPPAPTPKPLGLEASIDPQAVADTRRVIGEIKDQTRKWRRNT
jgi:hypothetical protein